MQWMGPCYIHFCIGAKNHNPWFFYLMAHPSLHTKDGFPSVISWCTVDYIRIQNYVMSRQAWYLMLDIWCWRCLRTSPRDITAKPDFRRTPRPGACWISKTACTVLQSTTVESIHFQTLPHTTTQCLSLPYMTWQGMTERDRRWHNMTVPSVRWPYLAHCTWHAQPRMQAMQRNATHGRIQPCQCTGQTCSRACASTFPKCLHVCPTCMLIPRLWQRDSCQSMWDTVFSCAHTSSCFLSGLEMMRHLHVLFESEC